MITEEEQKTILSENLRYYIDLTGKNQRDIAIDIDVNPPTFNQWVNGKAIPSVATLRRLAEYFNVALSDLAYKKPDPRSAETQNMMRSFMPYLNDENLGILISYSNAEEWIQKAVKKLLGYQGRSEECTNTSRISPSGENG